MPDEISESAPRPARKSALEAERDKLQADVERLKGELAEARAKPAGAASTARVTFGGRPPFLSEGERQDLEINGVTADAHGGGVLLASDHDVDVKTDAGRERLAAEQKRGDDAPREPIRGVDFVYPSVAPGELAADAPVRGAVVATPPAEA